MNMKKLIQTGSGIASRLGLVLVAVCGVAVSGAERSATWRFDSAEGSAPEVGAGFAGARAQVTMGQGGLGWNQTFPGVGEVTGLYDLGNRGRIELDLNGGVAGPAQLTVKVRQWFDGWIFGAFVSVDVPGARLANSSLEQMTPASVGSWIVSELAWEVPVGVTVASVSVTGPATGSVVDEVSVMAPALAPVTPLELSIRPTETPGVFELSWPQAAGAATVESASDLGSPEGWSELTADVQVVAGRYTVTTSNADGARYFRLKQ